MSGGAEAVAELASGAVTARALASPAGAGHAHGPCPNCGAALVGEFCHGCGQPAHLHRTLGAIGHEIAHGVFHFEGRIWHTLPLLAWRPGELTRRYVHGERARFIAPLALFLFCVFLMFAVFHAVGGPFGGGSIGELEKSGQHVQEVRRVVTASLPEARRRLAVLETRRDKALAAGADHRVIDRAVDAARQDLDVVERMQGVAEKIGTNVEDADRIDVGVPAVNRIVRHAVENPELLAYKLQSNAYKFSWLLIPLSLPFIWLAFAWRRDLTLYDHAIFAIHSLSFMTLLFVALSLLSGLGMSAIWTGLLLVLVPPVHLYRHVRGAYLVGRFGGLWRVAWLLVSAGVASLIFFAVLLSMGLSGD